MTSKLKWMVAVGVFALSLGFGVSSPAAGSSCYAQFQACLADGHTSKAMCLAELNECRRGNP